MLHVTHIVGQSLDLMSGQETPAGLIIANERGEQVLIPMSEHKLQEVMKLWLSAASAAEQPAPSPTETRTESSVEATSSEFKLVQPASKPKTNGVKLQVHRPPPPEEDEFADPVSGVGAA